jgi:uncharacterized protein
MDNDIQIRLIQEDDRVFLDMPDSPDNPCISCGACCQHFRISFYCGELTGGSGGFVPVELATMLNPVMACMKGTEAGGARCIALQGTVGQPGIACAIYANRPTPCREFPTWFDDGSPNPDCQRLRAAIGLPPLQPVAQAAAPAQAGTDCCKPLLEAETTPPYAGTHALNRHQH